MKKINLPIGINRLNGSIEVQRPLEYIKCWINRATNRCVNANEKRKRKQFEIFILKWEKKGKKTYVKIFITMFKSADIKIDWHQWIHNRWFKWFGSIFIIQIT